jgi:hypothetical protein
LIQVNEQSASPDMLRAIAREISHACRHRARPIVRLARRGLFVEPASSPATSTERQPRESQTPQLLDHHAVPAKIPPDDSSEFDLAQRLPSEAVVLCRSSPTKESQWNSYQPQSK